MALTRQEADVVLGMDQPLDVGDVAFVAALRAGRHDAFERLVNEYQSQLYSLALRIVQDREDARDVMQEVFIKALRALPETQGKLHLRAWLYRVTINASYDHLRACKRRPLPVENEILERPSLVDEVEQAELVRMFTETLRSLPRRQQVALLLKDVHGLPHCEIAEALGISRGSAEVLLFRARSGFRRTFATLSDETPATVHCGFAERQAARAVGAGLPPGRRRQLLEHARTCPDCRRTLEGIGGAALGLAVAFPLVALSGGTAAAAGLVSAAATGAAAGAGMAGALGTGAAASGGAAAAGASAAGGAAAGSVAAGGAAAGGMAGSGAVIGGIVAKLGALAGMKAAAAVVAGACVVTAGGVAGVEIVKREQSRAPAAGTVAGTPVVRSTVVPALDQTGGSAVRTDRGTSDPATVAGSSPSARSSVSPSPDVARSPGAGVTVAAGQSRRPAHTLGTAADLRRSPRSAFAAVVRRWHAAGLPWAGIEPWAGTPAWACAIAVLRSGAGGGKGVWGDGAQAASAGGVVQTAPVKKHGAGQGAVVTVTPTWQASTRRAGSGPQAATPTAHAAPTPHATAHRLPPAPKPRPTPHPQHTWHQAQPTPAPTPGVTPESPRVDDDADETHTQTRSE